MSTKLKNIMQNKKKSSLFINKNVVIAKNKNILINKQVISSFLDGIPSLSDKALPNPSVGRKIDEVWDNTNKKHKLIISGLNIQFKDRLISKLILSMDVDISIVIDKKILKNINNKPDQKLLLSNKRKRGRDPECDEFSKLISKGRLKVSRLSKNNNDEKIIISKSVFQAPSNGLDEIPGLCTVCENYNIIINKSTLKLKMDKKWNFLKKNFKNKSTLAYEKLFYSVGDKNKNKNGLTSIDDKISNNFSNMNICNDEEEAKKINIDLIRNPEVTNCNFGGPLEGEDLLLNYNFKLKQGRQTSIEIFKKDYNKLNSQMFLNDTIIYFYLK
jgi:hypothetical protein